MDATTKNYIIGILTITLLLSGVVYVALPSDNVKFRVDNDKSTFYVKEGGRWLVSGREYNSLWDGTSKMNRVRDSLIVNTSIDNETNMTVVTRYTKYIRGPEIIDTYVFSGNDDLVEHFPLSHNVKVLNGEGYIYQYEVRDLVYDGDTIRNVVSPVEFGRKMKIEWSSGNYWSTVYKSGILKVRYRVDEPVESFNVRLFDPNSAPVVNNVYLLPNNVRNDTDLQVYVNASDSDNSFFNVSCKLYVNDVNTYNTANYNYSYSAQNYDQSVNHSETLYGNKGVYKNLYTWTPNSGDLYVNNITFSLTGSEYYFSYVYFKFSYSDSTTWNSPSANAKNGTKSFSINNLYTSKEVSSISMYGYTGGVDSYGSVVLDSVNIVDYLANINALTSDFSAINVFNISSGNYSYNDNLTVSCMADDGVDTSIYVNSSEEYVWTDSPRIYSVGFVDSGVDVSDVLELRCGDYNNYADNVSYKFYVNNVLNASGKEDGK